MTTEPMRPARIAGLALLGVAAVATVLGVVTLLGGDGDSQAGQTTPPAATTTADGAPGTSGDPTTAPTTTAPPATTTKTTTTPPRTTTSEPSAEPTSPAGEPSYKDQPVRVLNNSTIKGLAERAKADFVAAGWVNVEVGNHQGKLYETTVYYRPGTEEEAAAKALAKEFDLRVLPRFDGIANADPGVIVIVTKEYAERPDSKG